MWAFKQLWDKGLVYEGYRVMPYSWGAETPLSNFEIRLDDATRAAPGPGAHGRVHARRRAPSDAGARRELLAWTTTPWTLPSNLALAVGPDIDYAVVEEDGVRYVLGAATVGEVREGARRARRWSRRVKGATLVGRTLRAAVPLLRRAPPTRSGCSPPTSSTPTRAPASCTWRPASARTTSGVCDGDRHRDGGPGRRRGPLHRRGARLGRPERLRGQPADHPRPQATRARSCATTRYDAQLPALLAHRHAAHLPRDDVVVRRGHRVPRPHGRAQPADQLDPRARARRRSSASGSRTRATGRSRATASGARRSRSGAATTPTIPRIDVYGSHRRARARLRRRRSPTCTARSSTSWCGRTPTTRPASR